MFLLTKQEPIMELTDFPKFFASIHDPRIERGKKHKLSDVLVIALIGVMCKAETFMDIENLACHYEDWLKSFLELPHGIPSHDTIRRVLMVVSPIALAECLHNFLKAIRPEGEGLAIDGKSIRSFNRNSPNKLHILHAYLTGSGLCVGHLPTEEKSNEITAIPPILKQLNVKDCVITIDAMGCQENSAKEIVDGGNHYVFTLKDNHPKFKALVEEEFRLFGEEALSISTVEKGHGRLEERSYCVLPAPLGPDVRAWYGIVSIVQVTRKFLCIKTKKETVEVTFYISSLPPQSTGRIARAIREHWHVENCLHWVLDVTFNEDNIKVFQKNSAENLSVLRKIGLNLFKLHDPLKKKSIRSRMVRCGRSHKFLQEVLLAGLIMN